MSWKALHFTLILATPCLEESFFINVHFSNVGAGAVLLRAGGIESGGFLFMVLVLILAL